MNKGLISLLFFVALWTIKNIETFVLFGGVLGNCIEIYDIKKYLSLWVRNALLFHTILALGSK
jgi:hypothetical protein